MGILSGGPREGALCLASVPPEAWTLEWWSRITNVWPAPDDTCTATLKLMSVADSDIHFRSLSNQALMISQSVLVNIEQPRCQDV